MNNEVKLGDYVEYEPEVQLSKKYKAFDSEMWEETDKYFSTQTGENALKWRYMGKDEKGYNLLVADRPTDNCLLLYGEELYTNGISNLNELCKELYSSPLGKARSINVDDVNKVLGANPIYLYCNKTGHLMDNKQKLTIGEIVSQKGEPALWYILTPEIGKSIDDYVADWYIYDGIKYKDKISDEYSLIFKNSADQYINYALASSYVYVDFINSYADFGIRLIRYSDVASIDGFNSRGDECGIVNFVRPVVVLNSNIQLGEKVNGVWTLKEV